MKRLVKIGATLLSALLIAVMACVPALADDSVSCTGGGTYKIGDEVSVKIILTGSNMDSFMASLDYDPTVLSGSFSAADADMGPTDYWDKTITLEVIGSGSTDVAVSVSYWDTDGTKHDCGYDSISVSVIEPTTEEPTTEEPTTEEPTTEEPTTEEATTEKQTERETERETQTEQTTQTRETEPEREPYREDDNDNNDREEEPETEPETETETTEDYSENLKVKSNGTDKVIIAAFTEEVTDDAGQSQQQENAAVASLEKLEGFTVETVTFEKNDVNVYRYKNLADLYVLTDENGWNAAYYTYDSKTKTFEPAAIGKTGTSSVLFLDIPDGIDAPSGYKLEEVDFSGTTLKAFTWAPTVLGGSTISLAESDKGDFNILYGIADGQTGYFSWDKTSNEIKKLDVTEVESEETTEETTEEITEETSEKLEIITKEDEPDDGIFGNSQFLIYVLIAIIAVAVIVILIIVLSRKNGAGSSGRRRTFDDDEDDEEDEDLEIEFVDVSAGSKDNYSQHRYEKEAEKEQKTALDEPQGRLAKVHAIEPENVPSDEPEDELANALDSHMSVKKAASGRNKNEAADSASEDIYPRRELTKQKLSSRVARGADDDLIGDLERASASTPAKEEKPSTRPDDETFDRLF